MDVLGEINSHLSGPSRAIVIADADVDMRHQSGDNRLFLLLIGEGSLAAGGRGGGFGERKVVSVFCYEKKGGSWSKLFQSEGEDKAGEFEVPYHVSRLPMTLSDGTESMGYGVVEPELVQEFSRKAGILSPP